MAAVLVVTAVTLVGVARARSTARAVETGGQASPAASPARSASAAAVPVLVELFTSEGCSSCPPADALLTELTGQQPVGGALVIGLSEHVDYWDGLGWRDPFSSPSFTARQTAYGAALQAPDIYTPQMIVDGVTSLVGSDRARGLDEIQRAAVAPKTPVHLAWQPASPSVLDVAVDASSRSAGGEVFLAVAEDGLASSVTRGENAGRRLPHTAVVRRLAKIGQTDRTGAFRTSTRVLLAPTWNPRALRLVVFAQARGVGRVSAVGAIGIPN
jgi:hypothetical protein